MADYLILPTLEPVVYKPGDTPLQWIARLVAQAEEARLAYEAKENQGKKKKGERSSELPAL